MSSSSSAGKHLLLLLSLVMVQALEYRAPCSNQAKGAAYALALRHLPPRASHAVSKMRFGKPAGTKAQTESFQSWSTLQLNPRPVRQTIRSLPAVSRACMQTAAAQAHRQSHRAQVASTAIPAMPRCGCLRLRIQFMSTAQQLCTPCGRGLGLAGGAKRGG